MKTEGDFVKEKMDQMENQPNEQPNDEWQKDRQNKEMRLWELGGKGDILSGWWTIIKAALALLLIIGLLIYGIYTEGLNQYFQGASLSTILLIIAFVILSLLYRIGLGIWEIFLGKSKLLRKQWTWWYTVVTLPLAYIVFLARFLYQSAGQTTPIVQIIIITSITLGFGALYYYVWTIKRKFEPAAVEPIKAELQGLSRWPLSEDRPLPVFIIGIFALFALLSPLPIISGVLLSTSVVGYNLLIIILVLSTEILSFIAGIGLLRMKKYGFITFLLASLGLVVLTAMNWRTAFQNIYLLTATIFILADIYLYFEKEKLN